MTTLLGDRTSPYLASSSADTTPLLTPPDRHS